MRRAAIRLTALAAVLCLVPRDGAAQSCDGQRINRITIQNAGLFDGDQRVPAWVVRLSSALSWRTRDQVIANDLLFSAGDVCDSYRLSESEQLLRRRPYLRSATIGTAAADSGVDVTVATRDDWSLGGDISVTASDGGSLRSLRVTETNLLGRGVLARARFDNRGREPGLVFDVLHRQVMGSSHAELNAGRTSVGPVIALALYHPFETELHHTGWFAGVARLEEPFGLSSDSIGPVTIPRLRETFGINALRRFGPERSQLLLGVSLISTMVRQSGDALAADPADDSLAQRMVAGRFGEMRRVSVSVVVGARSMRRATHSRLDAVNAVEEVREGVEVRFAAGRGMAIGSIAPDWHVLAEGFLGAHIGGRTLGFARLRAEGLRGNDTFEWRDVIAAGDVFVYRPTGRRGVSVVAIQAAGGWRVRQPFQLALGAGEGMRGFGRGLAVGRRLLGHYEYRHYAGTLRGIADIGWAAFIDAGRGWAGDAPFAVNSDWRGSAGGGLRLALPPGSKYVARVDLAVPFNGDGVEVRFSTRQLFSILRPEPADIRRSRQPLSTQAPFNSFPY